MALGMLVPVAFAASTTTGLSKASQLPIVVNGSVLSNPFEMTGKDSGNTTGFFPMYYFNQALAKIGFTATWDGVNHVWNISAPNVTAAPVAGGVGTGNTTVTVNGTVVKKFNTQAAKDPAGSTVTTYLPIFYINNVLSALGVKGTFSGQTGLSVTSAQSTTGAGLTTIQVSGETSGDGSSASPAVSLNNADVTLSTTLNDANGNALANTAVTFSVSNYGNYPVLPTVKNASGTVISGTKQTNAEQYTVYTDSTGAASVTVSGPSGQTYAYQVVATAPYQASNGMAVSSQSSYVEFVASNQVGLTPFASAGTPFNASIGSPVPVTVTLPPNTSGVTQANALVTLNANGHASFVSSTGAVLGQTIQVSTNASGVAQAFLTDPVGESVQVSVSGLPTGNNAPNPTFINFAQSGVPAKVANLSVSTNTPNIGTNVVVSGQLQDASGNAVASGQVLVTSPNGGSGNKFAYLSADGTTSTIFPLISSVSVGTPATAAYGDLVTADAAGNFNFSVTEPRIGAESFSIYSVANGQVQNATPLNGTTVSDNNTVTFATSTNLAFLSVGAFDSYVQGNSGTEYDGASAQAYAGGTITSALPSNQVATIYVEPQNSAGHHSGVLDTTAENYSLSADNGGLIYSINGTQLTNPAGAVTVSYDGAGNFTVNGQTIAKLSTQGGQNANANLSDFEVGVINQNPGTTNLTIQSGSVSSKAAIAIGSQAATYGDTFTPAAPTINPGQTATVKFTLEDFNGNPVANSIANIKTDGLSTDPLWITSVNGVNLSQSENIATGGNSNYQPEPTPIPLGNTPVPYSVNQAGVVSWSQGGNVQAYSDANGVVTLTFQAGGGTYFNGAGVNPVATETVPSIGGTLGAWANEQDTTTSWQLALASAAPNAFDTQVGQISWTGNGVFVASTFSVSPANAIAVSGTPTTVTSTVLDQNGNPLSGATVNWTVVAGTDAGTVGTLSATTSTTDASGHATVTYTEGTGVAASTDVVTAAVAGATSAASTSTIAHS
jgi:hypothetical protein